MEYLTPADVAKLAGVTAQAVKWNAAQGYLRVAARTPAGVHLFRRADVERWIAGRARKRDG